MALYSNAEFTVVISAFKKLHSDEELNENLKKRKVMWNSEINQCTDTPL